MKNIIYLVLTIIITAAFYVVLILILKIVTIADIKNYIKKIKWKKLQKEFYQVFNPLAIYI